MRALSRSADTTRAALHPLAALAPLELSRSEIEAVGAVRAAVDAVHMHPDYLRSRAAARASKRQDVRDAHVRAAAGLIRRTAEAAARRGSSFFRDPATI